MTKTCGNCHWLGVEDDDGYYHCDADARFSDAYSADANTRTNSTNNDCVGS